MEALWMGVPVLTKSGNSFLSNQGVGILTNMGLTDWIAIDEDDYVTKAIAFSSNIEKLAILRSELRKKVLTSPLCDPNTFSEHFETALWGMWKQWEKIHNN